MGLHFDKKIAKAARRLVPLAAGDFTSDFALQEKVPREPGAGYPFCAKYSGDSPVEYPDYDSDEE